MYGVDKKSLKRQYPLSFKIYFFRLVKSHFKNQKGIKRLKNPAPTFLLAGGKKCIMHEHYECPDDCNYATFN
jgi:hypothetical protein